MGFNVDFMTWKKLAISSAHPDPHTEDTNKKVLHLKAKNYLVERNCIQSGKFIFLLKANGNLKSGSIRRFRNELYE